MGQAGLLHKLKSCGIPGQMFGFISSFLSYRRCNSLKSLQEYPVNAVVPPGSILGATLFLQYINDPPYDAACNISIYTDYTTFYFNCVFLSCYIRVYII